MTNPRNGLAIAALVVAVIALLMGIGSVFSGLLGAIVFSGIPPSFPAGMDEMNGMQGTAPQVVSGQAYPGKLLQDEVTRVVGNFMGEATSVSCPATPVVDASAVTDCTGTVDGDNWNFKVVFEDGLGHFTLEERMD